jgi:hypothetical protein
MQIEPGVLSIIVSILTLVIGALMKAALSNRERELDRRIDTMGARMDLVDTRLHAEEKATIRQDGKIEKVEEADLRFQSDVAEIKATMARKVDVEKMESHIAAGFARVDAALQRLQGNYRGGTSGQIPVTGYDPNKK